MCVLNRFLKYLNVIRSGEQQQVGEATSEGEGKTSKCKITKFNERTYANKFASSSTFLLPQFFLILRFPDSNYNNLATFHCCTSQVLICPPPPSLSSPPPLASSSAPPIPGPAPLAFPPPSPPRPSSFRHQRERPGTA
jgi:hypothetical protein